MNDRSATIRVEVAYADPDAQALLELDVTPGTTALEAVRASGITEQFPHLDLEGATMGIFSTVLDGRVNPAPADYQLRDRDRVEIYRPLKIDPKQARRARANRNRHGKT